MHAMNDSNTSTAMNDSTKHDDDDEGMTTGAEWVHPCRTRRFWISCCFGFWIVFGISLFLFLRYLAYGLRPPGLVGEYCRTHEKCYSNSCDMQRKQCRCAGDLGCRQSKQICREDDGLFLECIDLTTEDSD